MTGLFNWFVKLTAVPFERFLYKRKVICKTPLCTQHIKGKAVIVSNHTSVQDYGFYTFVFFSRFLRCMAAEILYENFILGLFLRCLGCIYVNRNGHSLSYVSKAVNILNKNGVVLIFPEGRLPKENEERPLEFNPGYIYIAHKSNAPVIPVYTDGRYFKGQRANIVIGESINVNKLWNNSISSKENCRIISNIVRSSIIELREYLESGK